MTACEQFEILKKHTKGIPKILNAGKINKAGNTGLIVEYNGVTAPLYDDDDCMIDEKYFYTSPSEFEDWLEVFKF